MVLTFRGTWFSVPALAGMKELAAALHLAVRPVLDLVPQVTPGA